MQKTMSINVNAKTEKWYNVPPELMFVIKLFLFLMVFFALSRGFLLWQNITLAKNIPNSVISKSFLVGIGFDARISSMMVLPVFVWSLLPIIGWQYRRWTIRIVIFLTAIVYSIFMFLTLSEVEFYKEFQDRYNTLATHYILDDPITVIKMLWNGFPVITYTIIWAVIVIILGMVMLRMIKSRLPNQFLWKRYFFRLGAWAAILIPLLVFGVRGTARGGPPLRWGDACFSKYKFANHLALNGTFMLGRTLFVKKRNKRDKMWRKVMTKQKALEIARKMILLPGDKLVKTNEYPLMRIPGKEGRTFSYKTTPKNVVLILGETFSAQLAGATGNKYNATPEFDKLVKHGILFDRFFSQGTHTHQGMFATICSIPNLPGHEFIMQTEDGRQTFTSFISILKQYGFSTVYVYNGSFNWDNQYGFFRNQGMDKFFGATDFKNPKFLDPTWGVSDEEMFDQSLIEIDKITKKGPAFAFLQTLSNHAPYDLPPPAPFSGVVGPESLSKRLQGIRYADWAMGKFFEKAKDKKWFKETLFIILGDHSFAYLQPDTLMDITIQHIPLLFYYPGYESHGGEIKHTIGSQMDILPTTIGLLDIYPTNQCWGRDLFRLPPGDQGWAIIKPTGSSQVASYISGNKFFSLTSRKEQRLYKYNLVPWSFEIITNQPKVEAEFKEKLQGYVETAINALVNKKAGLK